MSAGRSSIPTLFGRYLLSGGAAAVVDVGTFSALVHLGFRIIEAAAASFLVAALFNYVVTSRLVYRVERLSLRRAATFFGFACLGLGINVSVTALVAQMVPFAVLAKTIGIGVAFVANFLTNTFLVFKPHPRRGS